MLENVSDLVLCHCVSSLRFLFLRSRLLFSQLNTQQDTIRSMMEMTANVMVTMSQRTAEIAQVQSQGPGFRAPPPPPLPPRDSLTQSQTSQQHRCFSSPPAVTTTIIQTGMPASTSTSTSRGGVTFAGFQQGRHEGRQTLGSVFCACLVLFTFFLSRLC